MTLARKKEKEKERERETDLQFNLEDSRERRERDGVGAVQGMEIIKRREADYIMCT